MRLGVVVVAAGVLSVAPHCSIAQSPSDILAKFCADLANPGYTPIAADNRYNVPAGLTDDQRQLAIRYLQYRIFILLNIRKNQMAREAEAQLNLLELGLPDKFKGKLPPKLDQVRKAAQNEAAEAERKVGEYIAEANFFYGELCPTVQPPSTVTMAPVPNLLFPGLTTALAAPLPPKQETGGPFKLVDTTPSGPNTRELNITDGKVTVTYPNYRLEATWTKPPSSFGPEGFTITMACDISPPRGENLASGVDMRGGFIFEPSPPSFECNAKNGQQEKASRTITVKPPPSQTSGDIYLQLGLFYAGGITYKFTAQP